MKIVINNCYGGFSLSNEGTRLYLELSGKQYWEEKSEWTLTGNYFYLDPPEVEERRSFYNRSIPRDDKHLIEVVERLGEKARGHFASLKIVEIPDDVKWKIEEYDGAEWIAEEHRTWS